MNVMFPTSSTLHRGSIYVFLLVLYLQTSQACSTSSLPSAYSSYPDCAAQCLACPDSDYVNNFYHNCNYTSGECCRSKYHTVIAASWQCVQSSCGDGMKLAQEAFDLFAQHCQAVGVPLASVDVPQGYVLNDTDNEPAAGNGTGAGSGTGGGSSDTNGSGSSTSTSSSSSSSLPTGTIVGIATGSVAATAGIIGVIFKCLSYRRKKKHGNTGGATPNNNNQVVPHRPVWEVLPQGAFAGDADARGIYNRSELSFAGMRRVKETFEITRQPTPPAAAVLGRGPERAGGGRVLGELQVE